MLGARRKFLRKNLNQINGEVQLEFRLTQGQQKSSRSILDQQKSSKLILGQLKCLDRSLFYTKKKILKMNKRLLNNFLVILNCLNILHRMRSNQKKSLPLEKWLLMSKKQKIKSVKRSMHHQSWCKQCKRVNFHKTKLSLSNKN